MGAASIAIITLTSVGTVAEGAGIVMVAGRVHDLIGLAGRVVRSQRRRYAFGKRTLAGLFPRPAPLALPGLRSDAVVDHVPPGGGRAGGFPPGEALPIRPLMGERITVVERRVDEPERSFDRLVGRLPVQIDEATKDPWLGLVLLFFGLACLLAAGVLGAVANQGG